MTSLPTQKRSGVGGTPARPKSYYLEAGREYVRRFGSDALTAAAFNPAAAKRGGRPDLVERYYDGRENDGGAWPSLNSIKKTFDGFTKFREALGLPPNSTYPAGGRRPPGTAEPIFNVRERRIQPSEQTVWMQKQVAIAERRALRAEERLEDEKAKVVRMEAAAAAVPPDQARLVVALRERLADEKHRYKAIKKELFNAERREERARARIEVLEAKDDPRALREIDRLTDRLAAAQSKLRERPRDVKTITKTKTRTRTVEVADERALRRAERAEAALAAAREDLASARESRDEYAARLSEIRREEIARVLESERVRGLESRVADLERELEDQGELLVGERRALSEEEVEKLRRDGPAGEVVFKRAVVKLARARAAGSRQDQKAALYEAMVAAKNWSDRL